MSENSLVTLAIIALLVSAVAAGYAYTSSNTLTAFATTTDTATVNLSVETNAAINFTTDNINFQSGRVNIGFPSADLNTSTGTVVGGNWTANSAGFILENIGNVNLTLNLSTGKTAATFLGGTSPRYQWNISNSEASSCQNSTGGVDNINLSLFRNVDTTGVIICNNFQFADTADRIRIDLDLVVPSDSFTGALGDTFTAIGSAP